MNSPSRLWLVITAGCLMAVKPGRGQHAAMPEGKDAGIDFVEALDRAFFEGGGDAQGAADQAQQGGNDPGDQRELNSLRQGEREITVSATA